MKIRLYTHSISTSIVVKDQIEKNIVFHNELFFHNQSQHVHVMIDYEKITKRSCVIQKSSLQKLLKKVECVITFHFDDLITKWFQT
jgi:hypothetical protein